MEKTLLPEKEYLESLPKKRMGVGVLLFFENKILILKPTYKNYWLLPGGVIELDESPREAAIREAFEELALKIEIKELLAVDYLHKIGDRTECVQFLFSGGSLSKKQIESIHLQSEEISEFRLIDISEAKNYLSERTAQRLSFIASGMDKSLYLENGRA